MATELGALPGGDLVLRGIEDLRQGRTTAEALLVLIGRPRLTALGVDIPAAGLHDDPEHELYALLRVSEGDAAHARYNGLVRRLVSFERALACAA
ncbi:MAG: hypothetical protein U0R50_15255 [Gaiellales bacterium]